jgi:hypothetical protein
MWLWGRKPARDGFPEGFKVQRIGVSAAVSIARLPPVEIVAYFGQHSETAEALLTESYDKRFTPSTFIMEKGEKFQVGWLPRHGKYQCVKEFSDLSEAATDYLLFSLGISRWNPGT